MLQLCPVLQKILMMAPTEEEKQKIREAQLINPDVPLGSAEQFLLALSSITELSARLQLWAFKLDYEILEQVCRLKRGFSRRRGTKGSLHTKLNNLAPKLVGFDKGTQWALPLPDCVWAGHLGWYLGHEAAFSL